MVSRWLDTNSAVVVFLNIIKINIDNIYLACITHSQHCIHVFARRAHAHAHLTCNTFVNKFTCVYAISWIVYMVNVQLMLIQVWLNPGFGPYWLKCCFCFVLLFNLHQLCIVSTVMPKTTTFKYVSSKSSGSSFSPTSIATTSNSATPSPATTTYSSTAHTERIERRHVNYKSDRTGWMDATDSQPHEAFFYVELLCNIWFIVEFTTRFLVILLFFCFKIRIFHFCFCFNRIRV